MADEAVRVGPPAATESYLNVGAIFKAIETTGAQAVSAAYVNGYEFLLIYIYNYIRIFFIGVHVYIYM